MFKLRASASGKVMTNPRSKSESISKTTTTFLQEWYKETLYGHRKEITNKYLSKGNANEDDAIDLLIQWKDLPFGLKNEKHFENEYFTGTPDLIIDGVVYDTKCSWDCFTFPLFEKTNPTKDYEYQLQVYMHLTGCEKAVLAYVLTNTPEDLTWEEKHDYSALNKNLRLKTFEFTYDESIIEDLKLRIDNCRSYLETIKIK